MATFSAIKDYGDDFVKPVSRARHNESVYSFVTIASCNRKKLSKRVFSFRSHCGGDRRRSRTDHRVRRFQESKQDELHNEV